MIFRDNPNIAIFILVVSTLILLLSQDWRKMILGLVLQYLGVFWLVAIVWPLGLAVVKIVVGWMVAAVLGVSRPRSELVDDGMVVLSARMFKFTAAIIIIIVIIASLPGMQNWFGIPLEIWQGGVLLVAMGLLQLGLTNRPFRVILGLLSVVAGFEIVYATLESSVLVTGLLAVINLGIVMVGSYMILGSNESENQ